MSENNINNILLGVLVFCLLCSICSCCYTSCVFGSFFTGVASLVSYVESKSSPKKPDISPIEKQEYKSTPVFSNPVYHTIISTDTNTNNNTNKVLNHSYLITDGVNSMKPGDYILSPNNSYKLIFQTDGDLVLYDLTSPSKTPINIWSTKTMNTGADKFTLTNSGDLKLTRGSTIIWSLIVPSVTRRNNYFKLVLQDDRNLVIYNSNNKAIWTSNTSLSEPELNNPPVNITDEEYAPVHYQEYIPEEIYRVNIPEEIYQEYIPEEIYQEYIPEEIYQEYIPEEEIYQDEFVPMLSTNKNPVLNINKKILSTDKKYILSFNSNHTVTLYPIDKPSKILWSISGLDATKLVLTQDGNLVLVNDQKKILWQSYSNVSYIKNAQYIMYIGDGMILIAPYNNLPIWTSQYPPIPENRMPKTPQEYIKDTDLYPETKYSSILVSDNNNHNSIGRHSRLESPDGKYTLALYPENGFKKLSLILTLVYPYDKYEEYMTIQSGDATKLLLLHTGNLVLTDDNNTIYWMTNTVNLGTAPYTLMLQNDRNLVLYDSNKKIIWSSNTKI